MVKASLAGSIIGNLLLVLGARLLAGGIKFPVQQFNRTAAGAGSTLMVLASVGLSSRPSSTASSPGEAGSSTR